jgi:hypothetical protein
MSRADPDAGAVAKTGLSLRGCMLRPNALGCAFKKVLPPGAFLARPLWRETLRFDEMQRQRRRAHRSNVGARITVGITPLTTVAAVMTIPFSKIAMAAAVKAQEFEARRKACSDGFVTPRRRPDTKERDELYMHSYARWLMHARLPASGSATFAGSMRPTGALLKSPDSSP